MDDIKKIWPKWEIVKVLGEGSFGKVYEIKRNEYGIEEHSAMKVIAIPQSDGEVQSLRNDGMTIEDTTEYFKGIVTDFVQEIRLMSKLKGNQHVVAYEDFSVIEKENAIGFEIFIRMELLTGLSDYMRERCFRVYDVIQLGIDMCKALEECRNLNIVHRDIKPDNIFVSSDGKFKLGDFGVARTIEKTMAGLSRKGTFNFMAPEIYKGSEYGFEADIYSLGIVLYKLLNNNREPFLPAYPNVVTYNDRMEALTRRIQGEELPWPENSDEVLSKIILKACAYSPSERYAHPQELRNALENVAKNYEEMQNKIFESNEVSGVSEELKSSDNEGTVLLLDPKNNAVILDSTEDAERIENDGLVCPVCKRRVKNGSAFCGFCGNKMNYENKVASKYCSHCGFQVKAEAKFCGRCGCQL